jgi:DNA-binding transcriptional ArsR family regulator
MDEILAQVARTIACHSRLRILRNLSTTEEAAPSQLSLSLNMPKAVLSSHLARLSSAGLISRRRAGSRIYCSASSPYAEGTLSGRVSPWLRDLLRDPQRAVSHLEGTGPRDVPRVRPEDRLYRAVFDAATAFASVRRIQILRLLGGGEGAGLDRVSHELHMSVAAASRHVDKLVRRGFVAPVPDSWPRVYRIADRPKSAIHGQLFDIVRATCRKRRADGIESRP